MQLNLWIILGTCVAGIVSGYGIYWIIIKIKNIRLANRSKSLKRERQTPLTFTEDIDDSSLEKPLNQAKLTPEIRRKTDTEGEEGEWLNKGVPEVSARTIHKDDDEWLNAGIAEVPTQDYKKQDDDWLNAENKQLLETVDESSLTRATTNPPEIQIKQDGSILNITVTKSSKQCAKPEQTVINLKINVSPQDSARKEEELYDVEITPSYQGLEDILSIKPMEESVNLSNALMDEISIRPLGNPVIHSQNSDS
jgi:hypothetical protein